MIFIDLKSLPKYPFEGSNNDDRLTYRYVIGFHSVPLLNDENILAIYHRLPLKKYK